MQQNRIFNNMLRDRPGAVILVTLIAMLFGMGLGAGLGNAVAQMLGVNVTDIMSWTEAHPLEYNERQGIRWFNLVAHFFSFTFVALVVAYLATDERGIAQFLQFKQRLRAIDLGWGIVLLICSLPLILASNWLNSVLPLPESLVTLENNQNWLVGEVLRMENFSEFLMALTVAAIAPAVGEELLFRGVLQPRIQESTRDLHIGVWVTAALFSAIHLQFVGFLPRMFLGALLGYSLVWSGSLWLPIILHFVFNAIQIVGAYLSPESFKVSESPEAIEAPPWWLVLVSAGLVFYIVRQWMARNKTTEPEV